MAGGCGGGGGGGGAPALLEISGAVIAPAGKLVADGPDLAPVPGATVELIEVDGNGTQVGPVLATSLTSTTGNYTLDNVSPNEVLKISGHLEQFDFFVAPTIEETIANLEAEAGPSLAPLLDLAQQPAGDASAIAGDYCFVQLGLVMATFPNTLVYTDVGDITIVDRPTVHANCSATLARWPSPRPVRPPAPPMGTSSRSGSTAPRSRPAWAPMCSGATPVPAASMIPLPRRTRK